MKTSEILSNFASILVLQIEKDGKIVKEIINSKPDLNIQKVDNIYDLFSPDEKYRLDLLLGTDYEGRKKYMEMNRKFKIKEFVDTQITEIEDKIYMYLEFFTSKREIEIQSDRQTAKLLDLSERDTMTQVLNRYGAWRRIRNILTCKDPEKKIGVIFVDIDNLKKVNDDKGHNAGDKAIRQISKLILGSIRTRDIVARVGGDEFIIIVDEPSEKRSASEGLANRLLRMMKASPRKYLTTISIGIHIVEAKDFCKCKLDEDQLVSKWEEAVKMADEAAYQSKADGKGTVSFSSSFKKFYK